MEARTDGEGGIRSASRQVESCLREGIVVVLYNMKKRLIDQRKSVKRCYQE